MAMIADAVRDVRQAARGFRRHPVVLAVAVLSLAIGIGANTAIVSVIDTVMVRSLPVKDPDGLVVAVRRFRQGTADFVTYPTFERLRDAGIFAAVSASAIVDRSGVSVGGAEPAIGHVQIGLVSANYFSTMGVRPAAGRLLNADDEGSPVAVLSQHGRQTLFGGADDVLGRSLTISGSAFTVVGIADPSFAGEDIGTPTDVWVPVTMQPLITPERPGLGQNPTSNWIRAIARLKPGLSMAAAESAARTVFAQVPVAPSAFGTPTFELAPACKGFTPVRDRLAKPLSVLMLIVGLVLLIACGNVAVLVLARAEARRKEMAVRLAIGANRGRLVRQLLSEHVLLAAMAGGAGLLLAVWLTRILATMTGASRNGVAIDVRPDARMLVISLGLSLITAILFGVLPAWRATHTSVVSALASAGGAGADDGRFQARAGKALVVTQVAACVVLLVGAGLLVRTFHNLETSDLGVDRDGAWLFWTEPMQSGRQGDALARVFTEAQARVGAIAGVDVASPSTDGVLSGFVGLRAVTAEGPAPDPGEDQNAQWNLVGPRFFEAIGMRIVSGRDFGPQDTGSSPRVAVVNETMARRFFGPGNAVGRRFTFGREIARPIEVVGVVRDAKYFSPRDAATPMVFLPYQQDTGHLFRLCLVVRMASPTPALFARIRQELQAIDPGVPVALVNSVSDQLDRTVTDERLLAWLAGLFGAIALLLAGIGLYGVMAFAVARRTREIGIRVALGETRGRMMGRVLRDSLALVSMGAAIGVALATIVARTMAALLFGVAPTDPLTIGAAIAFLFGVSTVAAIIPARRAATVDPVVALAGGQ